LFHTPHGSHLFSRIVCILIPNVRRLPLDMPRGRGESLRGRAPHHHEIGGRSSQAVSVGRRVPFRPQECGPLPLGCGDGWLCPSVFVGPTNGHHGASRPPLSCHFSRRPAFRQNPRSCCVSLMCGSPADREPKSAAAPVEDPIRSNLPHRVIEQNRNFQLNVYNRCHSSKFDYNWFSRS